MHDSAIQYRIELWGSIRRSKGFDRSFPVWWEAQEFAAAVGPLPFDPPGIFQTELIFQAFQHAFHAFEQWHLNQKIQAIQLKYERNLQTLFADLRDPRPEKVDFFWDNSEFQVVALKAATKAILLDRPPSSTSLGQWFLNGTSLSVTHVIEEILVFDRWPALEVGDVITWNTHTSNVAEVHVQLQEFWKSRWISSVDYDAGHMNRVVHFAQHFLPKLQLTLPPLTVTDWRKSVKRFRPNAARGADGWSKLDLLHMRDSQVEQLLRFISSIEAGHCCPPYTDAGPL